MTGLAVEWVGVRSDATEVHRAGRSTYSPRTAVPEFVHLATSHSRIVPSSAPEASMASSGENDTELTQSACPSRVVIIFLVSISHSRIVLPDPEASMASSGENDTN